MYIVKYPTPSIRWLSVQHKYTHTHILKSMPLFNSKIVFSICVGNNNFLTIPSKKMMFWSTIQCNWNAERMKSLNPLHFSGVYTCVCVCMFYLFICTAAWCVQMVYDDQIFVHICRCIFISCSITTTFVHRFFVQTHTKITAIYFSLRPYWKIFFRPFFYSIKVLKCDRMHWKCPFMLQQYNVSLRQKSQLPPYANKKAKLENCFLQLHNYNFCWNEPCIWLMASFEKNLSGIISQMNYVYHFPALFT